MNDRERPVITVATPLPVPQDELDAKLRSVGIELEEGTKQKLAAYLGWVRAWNEKVNLTRHTDIDRFVQRDIWDSWHLAECLEPRERVLDIGSGSGVPGIVLAILRPDLSVALCEQIGKKAHALAEIVHQLEMDLPVFHGRAEDLVADFAFDTLTARAVGTMVRVAGWFRGSWHLFGRLLLIKGPRWVEERGEARHRGVMRDVALRRIRQYPMIGTDSENVILQLKQKKPKKTKPLPPGS